MIERKQVHTRSALRAAYNDAYARSGFGERPRFYRWILDLLGVPAKALVVDVGCGAGGLVRAARARGVAALGLDLSDEAVRLARQQDDAGRYLVGDGERLPLADGSVFFLTHLGNLEHFLDPRAGAREVARVLAPGGRAAVMLPNSYYSGDLWRVIRTGYGPDHHQAIDRFATAGEWRDLLRSAGLAVERTVAYNKFKWWKRLLPRNLAYHFVFLCRPQEPGTGG